VIRGGALWLAVLTLLGGLVWWNAQPFRERGLHIRTKDLSFVPSPILGRVLSLGQCGAASKLRWIDSFSYFELQLDRRDDRLAGSGESGFQRLYDLLIALDPDWRPFYQHAAFNVGSLMGRHDLALGYLLRGIMRRPHDTELWRQAASELVLNFRWEQTQPAAMEAFLDQWAEAESTENGRRLVWDWVSAMARRRHRGIEQLGYWQEQLALATPDSPSAQFIDRTIREQLARQCLDELSALIEIYRSGHAFGPLTLDDLLQHDLIATRYPNGLPVYGPIIISHGVLTLRPDPFGFPFALVGGKPVSPGLDRFRADRRAATYVLDLADAAARDGRWPRNLAEVRAAGIYVADLPPGGAYRLVEHEIVIDWTPPPHPPWPLRELLKSP
jgi:hypothetical protein